MKKNVLVINDDLEVCKLIEYNLENECTDVYYARTVEEGLVNFIKFNYTLVIMDIALSETNGLELIETMRRCKNVPIFVLSSKCAIINDKVSALNAGADDFLSHPFDMTECLARAQALIRRYTELGGEKKQCYTLVFGSDLIIEPQCRNITLKGKRLELTRKEYDMLYYLARHAGQVFSREQLYSQIWNSDSNYNIDDSVRSHIKSLRKKMGPGGKEYIRNVWGVGYCFIAEKD